jgi:hypothetical protein
MDRSRRLAWLLVVFASLPIVFACRGSKERPMPSAESRNATPGTRVVKVEQLGRLQKVINEAGVATTGVAHGVHLIRDGRDVTPELGIELRDGDRVVTEAGTRAVIGTGSSAEISLGASSDFTIRRASGFLLLGSLLVSVKRLFRVETRFVVAGVEGTEFSLSIDSSDITALEVLEGSVRVESKADKWAPRSYAEGEKCVARGAAEPEKRVLDDQGRERLLRWRQDFGRPTPGASSALWDIRRSDRAVSTGRILLDLPSSAHALVEIFKGEVKAGYWYGKGSKSLLPGNYDVTVSGAPVASVPVQSRMDTRIRAGVLKVKVDGLWELYDSTGTRKLHYEYGDREVCLPVGAYQVKIGEGFGPVIIRDKETTEF